MDFSLIGLSGRDKRIYEALLTEPQVSVRHIADATSINRGSVFESIKALRSAGLVTTITLGKRQVYRAKEPEVLHEIIREKRSELRSADERLTGYIDSLQGNRAERTDAQHFASFYQDDEGLAAILRDVLKTCRSQSIDHYDIISSPRVSAYLYANFPHFTRERERQQLFVRVLRQGKALGEVASYAESRYFGETPTDTGCYTLIYGSKVALISANEINQTSGIIIDNAHYAAIQRQLFEDAWQRV